MMKQKIIFPITFFLAFFAISQVARADRDITVEVYVVSGANTPVAGATIIYNTWHDATYRRIKADMNGKVVLSAKYTLRIYGVYAEGCQKIENSNDFWQPDNGKNIRTSKIYRMSCQTTQPAQTTQTIPSATAGSTWGDKSIAECKYHKKKRDRGDRPGCNMGVGGVTNAYRCCCTECRQHYYDANNASPNPDYSRNGRKYENCQRACESTYLR